jgi:ribosome-associated protein
MLIVTDHLQVPLHEFAFTFARSRNVDDCLEKLRAMLAEVAAPPRRRKPSRPTQSSRRRRLEQKRATSQRKASRRKPGME